MGTVNELISNLNKYRIKGQFLFSTDDRLSQACNISVRKDYSGLYLFYEVDNGELIYIGISGRSNAAGEIVHRKDGLRGRFLTGKQFGERRSISLPSQMIAEGISALNIHWFVTYGEDSKDIPRPIEISLLETFRKEYGRLPKWNKKI